jgi:uncharacterized protein YjeT (DUF2065 family)
MDMWHTLAVAFALLFIIEGMIPFVSPNRWRKLVVTVAQQSDSSMRVVGLVSMLFGLGLLYLIN